MIPTLIALLVANKTMIALGAAYVYALVAGAQPPLAPNAGYYKTWAYKIFQAGAANFQRRTFQYADPASTSSSTSQSTVDSPVTTIIKGK